MKTAKHEYESYLSSIKLDVGEHMLQNGYANTEEIDKTSSLQEAVEVAKRCWYPAEIPLIYVAKARKIANLLRLANHISEYANEESEEEFNLHHIISAIISKAEYLNLDSGEIDSDNKTFRASFIPNGGGPKVEFKGCVYPQDRQNCISFSARWSYVDKSGNNASKVVSSSNFCEIGPLDPDEISDAAIEFIHETYVSIDRDSTVGDTRLVTQSGNSFAIDEKLEELEHLMAEKLELHQKHMSEMYQMIKKEIEDIRGSL